MPAKLQRLIKAYYASTKTKARTCGGDSLTFDIRSSVGQGWALLPTTLFNYIIDWILGQALQGYPGVQVGANVHVSDLAYADDIVLLSNSYPGHFELAAKERGRAAACFFFGGGRHV